MHVLLLLAQEVSRDGVQGVAAQLVVSLDGLQQIKLDAAINGDLLVVICAICFAAELGISHAELAAADNPRFGVAYRAHTGPCSSGSNVQSMQFFSLTDAVLMTPGPHQLQVLVVLKPRNHECLLLLDAAPVGELGNFQRFCPLNEVWQVKVDNIVSNDDVRI